MLNIISAFVVYLIITFVILYDVITLPIYLLIQNPISKLAKSNIKKITEVKIGDSQCKTYANSVRHIKYETTYKGMETLYSVLRYAADVFRYQKCLGTREVLSEKEFYRPDGTKVTKYIIGGYKWKNYNAIKAEVTMLSRGLRSLGVEPKESIAILAETREEWMISAMACIHKDIALVVLDISMEPTTIIQILNETGPSVMITSHEFLPKILSFADQLPMLKILIYIEHQKKEMIISNFPKTINMYTYMSVLERGKNIIVEGNPPEPDSIALIVYGNGMDDTLKGVIVTHRNLVAAMKCSLYRLHLSKNDVIIGYLLLSNINELILELAILMVGGSVGYSSNFTITDLSMKVIFGANGDAAVLQPTVMFTYPFLLEKYRKFITKTIENSGVFTRKLMKFGISYKKFWILKGFETPLTNRIIFSRMANVFGGKMRMIICGGAHIPSSTQLYASVTLCSAVVQSYTLMETTSVGMCQNFEDLKMGLIGKPLVNVYVRLEEVFTDLCSTNQPSGEIILGGDCVSPGYFNLPSKTSEVFFIDGNIRWFRTGDIAIMHKNGSFELVGRKTDIIKLDQGKCVPLGKLEALYRTNEWVKNIFLHGKEERKCIVAILVPEKEYMSELAKSLGLEIVSYHHLTSELKFQNALIELVVKHAKSCKLSPHEIPEAITIVDHEWTPETGLITPNHQLKRKLMYAKYEAQITFMYDVISKNRINESKSDILIIAGD